MDITTPITPLVELLQREISAAGIQLDAPEPTSIQGFTLWYLEAIQLLELHCALEDRQAGMTRKEVELLCRCALSARDLREAMILVGEYCEMLNPRAGRTGLLTRSGKASFRFESLRGRVTATSSLVDITGLFAYRQLFQWWEEGKLKPHVGASYAFEDAGRALRALLSRKVAGKIVLEL